MRGADMVRWATMAGILLSVGVMVGWSARVWIKEHFPASLWVLQLSYALYAFAAVDRLHDRLGHGFAYRSSVALFAAIVGVTGQLLYARHVWKDANERRGPPGPEGARGKRGKRGKTGKTGEQGEPG